MQQISYNEFIQNIINTRGQHSISEDCYFERHHIEPRYKGGEGDYKNGSFKKRSTHSNCIYLYADEHYLAHKLYALDHPDDYYAQLAWEGMAYKRKKNNVIFISENEYKAIKEAISNCPVPDEYRAKLSAGHKGHKNTASQNASISKALTGLKRGPQTAEHTAHNVASRKANNDLSASAKKAWETRRANGTAKGYHPSKAVRCIETGEVFESIKAAKASYKGHIGACCTGERKTAAGYHWEYYKS